MKAPKPTYKETKLINPGNYIARLIQIINTGTRDGNMGKKKTTIRLTWELPTELEVFDESKGEQPYLVTRSYNFSMYRNPKTNESAPFRAALESWRGKVFTEAEAEDFDITALLNKYCMVNIIHLVSEKNNKTYANVDKITPLPKGIDVPPGVNPTLVYDVREHDEAVFQKLPTYLQDEIKGSDEWVDVLMSVGSENSNAQEPKDDLPF